MLSPGAGTANGAWLATSVGQHWASKPDWPGSHTRPAKAVPEDGRRGPRQPRLVSNPPPLTGQVHGLQELGHQGAIPLLLGLHEAQLPAHLLQVVPAELGVELVRQDGLGQLEGQRRVQGLGQLLQVPLAHLGLLAVRVAPGGVGGVAHVIRVVPATRARVGWCLKGPIEGPGGHHRPALSHGALQPHLPLSAHFLPKSRGCWLNVSVLKPAGGFLLWE